MCQRDESLAVKGHERVSGCLSGTQITADQCCHTVDVLITPACILPDVWNGNCAVYLLKTCLGTVGYFFEMVQEIAVRLLHRHRETQNNGLVPNFTFGCDFQICMLGKPLLLKVALMVHTVAPVRGGIVSFLLNHKMTNGTYKVSLS